MRQTPDLPAVADWEAVRFCDPCWRDYQDWFNAAPSPDRRQST